MRRIEDCQYYYYRWINKDGWMIALERVMFGTRVLVYRDNITINGSFCGGSNPEMVEALFNGIFSWLSTNPEDVEKQCATLHQHQLVRPFGKDLNFMLKISELEKKSIVIEHPKGIFELQPIK